MSITVVESTRSKQDLVSRAKKSCGQILISTRLLDPLPAWRGKEAFQSEEDTCSTPGLCLRPGSTDPSIEAVFQTNVCLRMFQNGVSSLMACGLFISPTPRTINRS